MRTVFLLAAVVGLFVPAIVQAQPQIPAPRVNVFRLDAPATLLAGEHVAKRGKPLAIFELRGRSAVRLEGRVDAKADNWLGASLDRPLAAGQVLTAAPGRPGVYCAPVKEGMLYSVGPCLIDHDGDGQFEGTLTAAFDAYSSNGLMVTNKQNLLGVLFSDAKPLAVPVGYSAVEYRLAPFANAELRWSAKRTSDGLDLDLQLDASDNDSGTHAWSARQTVHLPGGAGEARIGGVTVRVADYDEKTGLRYSLAFGEAGHEIEMGWVMGRQVMVIFY